MKLDIKLRFQSKVKAWFLLSAYSKMQEERNELKGNKNLNIWKILTLSILKTNKTLQEIMFGREPKCVASQ